MLDQLPGVATTAAVYACRPVSPRRQERARALCLHRLPWDATGLGITELVFESRQARNDQKDRQTILRAQKAGRAPAELTYPFERPSAEPLLWLPDAVAGAVAAGLTGDAGYLERLGKWVAISEIDP